MTKRLAILLLVLVGVAALVYMKSRAALHEHAKVGPEALRFLPPDPNVLAVRGCDFYVRLRPEASQEAVQTIKKEVGDRGVVYPRGEWAVVLWNDFYAPKATLRDLSSTLQTDVIWLSFQKQVDAFEFQRWSKGRLHRRLTFGCYEKERTWEHVEGEAEQWEEAALFDPRDLEREVGFLKEYPPEGKSVVEAEAELRAIWRERRLLVDSDKPNITGRDAAEAVAVAYGLPGWEQ